MSGQGSTLDFVVIGAQKSGTTSLFHYLREHPGLYLPAVKEAPFFHLPRSVKEREAFARELFSAAAPGQLRGKVSPQYMTSDSVVSCVCDALPDAKFIAVVRDPVARAVSHYRMMVARGTETRGIDAALRAALAEAENGQARELGPSPESETRCYVAWGEYERILSGYLRRVGSERLLVVSARDLDRRPQEVLRQVFRFLGVDEAFVPANLGERFFSTGRVSMLWRLKSIPGMGLLRGLMRRLPFGLRHKLHFWLDERLTIGKPAPAAMAPPDAATEAALVAHFAGVRARSGLDYSALWSVP